MKKFNILLLALILLPLNVAMAYQSQNPNWQYQLEIESSAPPALLYVKDSQGRFSGGSPSLPVEQDGMQSSYLNEIPNSFLEPYNIANIITGQPSSTTGWDISIDDDGIQSYSVYLKGLAFGDATVELSNLYSPRYSSRGFKNYIVHVLVAPGVTRELTVNYDPFISANNIQIIPVIHSDDLITDVQTVCKLNLISSDRVCHHLEREAKLIEIALNHHREEEAEHLVRNFLWSLGTRKESHFFDIDRDHEEKDDTYIKQPVLSVLQQDAQALLAQIEQGETSESKHNHS